MTSESRRSIQYSSGCLFRFPAPFFRDGVVKIFILFGHSRKENYCSGSKRKTLIIKDHLENKKNVEFFSLFLHQTSPLERTKGNESTDRSLIEMSVCKYCLDMRRKSIMLIYIYIYTTVYLMSSLFEKMFSIFTVLIEREFYSRRKCNDLLSS